MLSPKLKQLLDTTELIVSERIDSTVIRSKSVNEVLREYNDRLTRWVVDASNGNISAGEMSRAMKSLVRRLAPLAYDEGLREGGVSDPEAERDDKDDETIEGWVSGQLDYVLDFAKDAARVSELKGDARTSARNGMLNRVSQWVDSLRGLSNLGYASARRNEKARWVYDPSKEHCDSCAGLNGKEHRLSWFASRGYLPSAPGSATDCKGFHCGCKLVSVRSGNVLLP